MKKNLQELTKEEFEYMKKVGMLWSVYPEAPEFWEDITIGRKIKQKLSKKEIRKILSKYKEMAKNAKRI